MSSSPYIPNIEAWKKNFGKSKRKNFHIISNAKQTGEDIQPVKLVTPTAQIVAQAKSTMKRERMDADLPKPKRKRNSKKIIKTKSKRGNKKYK